MSKEINLRTLRRIDPDISDILASFCSVALYRYDMAKNEWTKSDVEGSLHVFQKDVSITQETPVQTNPPAMDESLNPIIRKLLFGRRTSLTSNDNNNCMNGHHSAQGRDNRSSTRSQYGFVILNRISTFNPCEVIASDMQTLTSKQFLLYKNSSKDICCVWFYKRDECDKLSRIIDKLRDSS